MIALIEFIVLFNFNFYEILKLGNYFVRLIQN